MDIILIAVMATNRVIGRNNTTPWHIPEELSFFKATTMGYPVVMGRKTYESLSGPLPGRKNIVISRNPDYCPDGTENAGSLEQALDLCQGKQQVFILGGEQIFTLALPLATTIILSVLDREVDGDTYFPEFSAAEFEETGRERHDAGEPFTVIMYKRVRNAA